MVLPLFASIGVVCRQNVNQLTGGAAVGIGGAGYSGSLAIIASFSGEQQAGADRYWSG